MRKSIAAAQAATGGVILGAAAGLAVHGGEEPYDDLTPQEVAPYVLMGSFFAGVGALVGAGVAGSKGAAVGASSLGSAVVGMGIIESAYV